jgi:tRNA threonylcarbamoyladenosine biosynthesis protein TsaB
MKLLAVDTALGACSAAVLDDDTVLAHAFESMERGHAERLAPMVREVMAVSGTGFGTLDGLAVTIGPGTFTGQRVGYAFMRGLRIAIARPLIGVTTLSAMAHAAMAKTETRAAAVLHDAKRNEVYFTLLADDGKIHVPARLNSFDDAVAAIRDAADNTGVRLAVAGTAAQAALGALRAQGLDAIDAEIVSPDALWVARLARTAWPPEAVPQPLYLRPPDARLPKSTP